MKKLILFNMLSLDGFFAGPHGELDWHNTDEEFNDFAIRQLEEAGTLLFGRLTYQLMADYWPTPAAVGDDPVVAGLMNSLPKIVFSRILKAVEWNNTRIAGKVPEEMQDLKSRPGRDLLMFGSAVLAAALDRHGLIDEYRLMVAPVVLGKGIPLFKDAETPRRLKFLAARPFRSGNLLVSYANEREA